MPLGQFHYRLKQFWLAFWAGPDPEGLQQARQMLGPSLWPVFAQMQPGEQAHSLDVMRVIRARGHDEPALLQAALLHDCGKSRSSLSVWDRTWIVLARKFFPAQVRAWGQSPAQRLAAHLRRGRTASGLGGRAGCLGRGRTRRHRADPPSSAARFVDRSPTGRLAAHPARGRR